jgi:hydroxypyruvate isomerase
VKANHEKILDGLQRGIPIAAANKVPNLITFFGNRRGMGDPEAAANCVEALNQVKGVAEEHGVNICVRAPQQQGRSQGLSGRPLRLRRRHRQGGRITAVKLLYDIYHMQIMEGDVIRTIRENQDAFAHFHTGGVPGRHELDDTQELNWRPSRRR